MEGLMDVCDTASLPERGRIAAWNRLFAAHGEQASFHVENADGLSAEIAAGDLGPLRLTRLRSDRGRIERGALPAGGAAERSFTILLNVSGDSLFSHYGHSIRLEAGDFSLVGSGAPYRLDLSDGSELLLLRVPAAMLKEHLPSPECYCGKLLADDDGLTSTAAAMALNLFERLERGLALHYQARVARHLLDMIATSYAIAFDDVSPGSSIVSGRHATVKLYIEQHLRDPDLSPCSIASRLKLSARYLRMIFATSKETVSAYILRRRLEECARQIADPSWRGHSLTEIAFGWGFNSAPHFTRSFRDRYDMSPREYRRLKLEEHGTTFRRPPASSRPTGAAVQAA
jgi:AraC family transcriptional activator of tynA and feaB